jgi:citrate synthase
MILQGLPLEAPIGRLIAAARELTGQAPSLDLALVALRRSLGMPPGSAFALFAIGRTVGWLAHALEQRELHQLIRPRAAYVGPRPQAAPAAGRVVRPLGASRERPG